MKTTLKGIRSYVAFAHRLAEDLKTDWVVNETHRDKNRRKETVNR